MNLFRREMTESWRGLAGWSLGVIGAALLYISFYPSVGGAEMIDLYMGMFPAEMSQLFGLDRMGSGAGYVQATYFNLMGFLLLTIAGIGWGTRSIAGQEEDGTLELTLAHGVTRWHTVLEAALALFVKILVLALVGSLLILVLNGPSELGLDFGNLMAATVALFLLSLLVGIAALSVGAIAGRRSAATAAGAIVAVGAYALDAVSATADLPWLARVSPFNWAFGADPITTGMDWGGTLLLAGSAVVILLLAGAWFNRRDVGA